jgi:hypothetical protein
MKTPWITIALFDNAVSAKALESFLREKRIDARIFHDKVLEFILFLGPPQPTFQVQVRKPIYKMTLELLQTNVPPMLEETIHCPVCGSIRVRYPNLTRGSLWSTLTLNLAIIFRARPHQACCEDCHHVWNLPKLGSAIMHRPVPRAGG